MWASAFFGVEWGGRTGKHGGCGRGTGLPVSDALRWQPANLLPVTKFIARALFTKCLGQVDLPGAPRTSLHTNRSPAFPSTVPPDVLMRLWMKKMLKKKMLKKKRLRRKKDLEENKT